MHLGNSRSSFEFRISRLGELLGLRTPVTKARSHQRENKLHQGKPNQARPADVHSVVAPSASLAPKGGRIASTTLKRDASRSLSHPKILHAQSFSHSRAHTHAQSLVRTYEAGWAHPYVTSLRRWRTRSVCVWTWWFVNVSGPEMQ